MKPDSISFERYTSSDNECDCCESTNIDFSLEELCFHYGTGEKKVLLSADVPVKTCNDCGMQTTCEEAEEIRANAVSDYLGVRRPKEIREIRMKYGLSRAKFSELSRIGEASLARWETGKGAPNAALNMYLGLLENPQNLSLIVTSFMSGCSSTDAPSLVARRIDAEDLSSRFQFLKINESLIERSREFQLA